MCPISRTSLRSELQFKHLLFHPEKKNEISSYGIEDCLSPPPSGNAPKSRLLREKEGIIKTHTQTAFVSKIKK